MECRVPNCPVVAWKHGLCKDHWMANAREEPTGLPIPGLPAWARGAPTPEPARVSTGTTVSHPLPTVPAKPTHDPRPRARSHEQPPRREAPPKQRRVCIVEGCDRWVACKGRCSKHYQQSLAEQKRTAARALAAQAEAIHQNAQAPELLLPGEVGFAVQVTVLQATPEPEPPEPAAPVPEPPRAPPAPLTGAPLEPAALRLVWSCVPQHGAQLHEVADACGLGLGATVTALHTLETTYGYVTFDGARWRALIPCGRQQGERLWTPKT